MPPNSTDYIELANRRAAEKKTHVSFPQLKYPSLRDGGLKDSMQWLRGKAMDDGAEGLWRVYNGIYDFNDFMKIHPGGEEWLKLTKGTDITEAFECHHLNPAVEKMLEKFFIRPATTPRNSPFTFEENGFYRSLKREVYEVVKKVPKSVPRRADMIIDGIFTSLLVFSALACYFTDYWLVMGSYLIASLSLAWLTSAAHNYIHRRTNWRMYLFSMSLWSYRDFRVSHALSHHVYPNTLMDLEVSAFEPLIWWNPRDVGIISYFSFLYVEIIYPFLFMINFVKRIICNFKYEGFFRDFFSVHDLVGFLLPVWMWVISGTTFYDAVVMWLWINCTGSLIFYNIGANAAHHHPDIFKDGDQIKETTLDWGMHEVEAAIDRMDINENIFTVMTFFGDHVLHHLFPTIDHAVLSHLYPVFLDHVERYKAKFRLSTQLEMIVGQIRQTIRSKPNTLPDDEE